MCVCVCACESVGVWAGSRARFRLDTSALMVLEVLSFHVVVISGHNDLRPVIVFVASEPC